jgi:hypothetical protein
MKDSIEITVQESGQQSAGATVENDPRFCGFSESEQQSGHAFACLVGFPLGAAAVGALIGFLIQSAREGSKSNEALYGAAAGLGLGFIFLLVAAVENRYRAHGASGNNKSGFFRSPDPHQKTAGYDSGYEGGGLDTNTGRTTNPITYPNDRASLCETDSVSLYDSDDDSDDLSYPPSGKIIRSYD